MMVFCRPARARRHAIRAARSRWLGGAAAGVLAALVLPGLAAAHPLGNFTINHYAGVRIEPDRILLDVVIDQAEIPAFQARLGFDVDGDGELSATETDAGRVAACRELAALLDVRVGGDPLTLELTEAGLTFPPGAGGLSTMRSVCGFEARLAVPLESNREITFADRSYAERLGWREIVVQGSGVSVTTASSAPLRTSSPSNRLTVYPTELLARALTDTEVVVAAAPGGPALPELDIPDAEFVPSAGHVGAIDGAPRSGDVAAPIDPVGIGASAPAVAAAVPGGIGAGDLPAIFRAADLTPVVLLVSILTAAALGAGHALTPGHGKTLMAAYLVGTRGTPVHAAGLGLSVALSHTLGILALAALVVGAQGVLPPEIVVRTAPVVAAISIVAIGGWMLIGEVRRRMGTRETVNAAGHDHEHPHEHEHGAHDHDHDHEHAHPIDERHGTDQGMPAHGEHSHGGLRHSHLPATGSSISWRSLFVLGLAGGLIPSASALLILLGSIAAGRPAFGFLLVVAFGLGMALVMGGIGLALVIARSRLDRVDTSTWLGRVGGYLPLVASFLVLGFGLYLTVQAVSGNTTL
jgi:ABC-type nickel/cobalt efflux system permease component RcnA